ncbi:MAG: reverse transcriptase domain-containing protein [Candidatus Falkowbacteria bacterium]
MNIDFDELISLENLLQSWRVYKAGKSAKMEVMEFERHLEDNLFDLHYDLREGNYRHGGYEYFRISDPKKRDIYKASVRDRVLHQAIYVYLCKVYEPIFVSMSFSSRKKKGVHKAVSCLQKTANNLQRGRQNCLAMKCDIRKYFDSINHRILLEILTEEIVDKKVLRLLMMIIESFRPKDGKGVPLGNITSQIFANVYLNELDVFVLNRLGLKDYVRYNDDFIIMAHDKESLFTDTAKIREFVRDKLMLDLPENKTIFRKLVWGIDFCGSIVLPNAIMLRNKTKGRMFDNLDRKLERLRMGQRSNSDFQKVADSYFGLLSHAKSYNLRMKIKNRYIYVSGSFLNFARV